MGNLVTAIKRNSLYFTRTRYISAV